ncbi:MAG TPA: NAD(P)/FAD-dependent oxidoreductase [Pseudonocardiaceae bacterium]|jgi:2-polyprenyl-6-methoxyphenol hydroxylase-like FAD-dependent oxidoreductase|nr:NAD(P)/FAD-dependent oxidoreductase [Pseudonocardiaceae bacterium]
MSSETTPEFRPATADVVVVGARISGASLAIHLARAGRRVVLVDRAGFPSDTLSTHLMQVSGVAILAELGLLEQLKSTGAPFVDAVRVDYDKVDLDCPVYPDAGQPPGGISVSRNLLDGFLFERAVAEGVDVREHTTLVDLLRGAGQRVEGVVLRSGSTRYEVRAPLVVGADGRNSRVAELAGSRTYNTTANQRFAFWADFVDVNDEGLPPGHQYRDGAKLTIAFHSDGGRFTAVVAPGLAEFAEFKRNLPDSYDRMIADCPQLRPILHGAKRVTRPVGTAYLPGYFRESAGRGWALIGDAGHFKDPTIAQGISDALRQAKRFAAEITSVPAGDGAGLDRATRRWWKWRDKDATPMYWLAYDFAKSGELGPLEREILRVIGADPKAKIMMIDKVMSHRLSPYRVLTPPRILRAAIRLVLSGQCSAGTVGRLLGDRLALEIVRKYRQYRPVFAELPKPAGGAARTKVDGDAWAGSADGRAGVGTANALAATHTIKPLQVNSVEEPSS